MGTGTDMFNAWETGASTRTINGVITNVIQPCSHHRRASLVDRWAELGVRKVFLIITSFIVLIVMDGYSNRPFTTGMSGMRSVKLPLIKVFD